MVEEDQGKHTSTMARLELLSSTAVLRKVLDKRESHETVGGRSSKETATTANHLQREVHIANTSSCVHSFPRRIPSTDSSSSRSLESPRPGDTPRDAPPQAHLHTAPVPSKTGYGYNRGEESYQEAPSLRPGTHYPVEASFPRYIHGSHGDLCFLDNSRFVSAAAAAAAAAQAHMHHNPGSHHLYHLKENVPPPPIYRPTYGPGTVPPPAMFAPTPRGTPEPDQIPPTEDHRDSRQPSYDALVRETHHMREQLKEKDIVVSSLQQRVNYLEKQISELRQLPTGKISHIPIDDMIRIMQEYGSEVSNQTLPKRKTDIKKASIVRQFRRWNPEFFRYFIHVNGEWVPKLGKEGELKRRAEKRRTIKNNTGKGY